MSNPYIEAKRKQYDAIKATISGLQTRAVDEKRDLTADELTSIGDQSKAATAIADEIKSLAAVELRDREVAELGTTLFTGDNGPTEAKDEAKTRSLGSGGTRTQDRDPGHYRSTKEGGVNSFFSDLYRAKEGDTNASTRLAEHHRALATGTAGVGVVPPKWLTDEFETIARQGRSLANAVRRIPLGDDPRPITLPGQTAGTDAVVAEQAAENDPVAGTDAWDSDVVTVTPKPTAGKQTVSRQMLDMSTPAIDTLIFGDLMSVYNMKVENKVGAAIVAAAGTAVTTLATDAAFGANAAAIDAVIDIQAAVRNARKLPANILTMSVNRWAKFKKLKDTANRPLIPVSTYGPANVAGIGTVAADGEIEALPVIATDGVGNGTTFPESVIALRSTDVLFFETEVMRFRYEEVQGPESVVLGIWGYTAVIVRQVGKSVKRFVITAASA